METLQTDRFLKTYRNNTDKNDTRGLALLLRMGGKGFSRDPKAEWGKARNEALGIMLALSMRSSLLTMQAQGIRSMRSHSWQDAKASYNKCADLGREAETGKINCAHSGAPTRYRNRHQPRAPGRWLRGAQAEALLDQCEYRVR
ncbi:MAG: hypothetical protein QM684_18500 [Rhizobium sp.]